MLGQNQLPGEFSISFFEKNVLIVISQQSLV